MQILEENLSHPGLLIGKFNPDSIIIDENNNLFLLRDEDLTYNKMTIDDVKEQYNTTLKDHELWNSQSWRQELESYWKMILDKMIVYDRDRKIDILINYKYIN